jgi:hypothetical protein
LNQIQEEQRKAKEASNEFATQAKQLQSQFNQQKQDVADRENFNSQLQLETVRLHDQMTPLLQHKIVSLPSSSMFYSPKGEFDDDGFLAVVLADESEKYQMSIRSRSVHFGNEKPEYFFIINSHKLIEVKRSKFVLIEKQASDQFTCLILGSHLSMTFKQRTSGHFDYVTSKRLCAIEAHKLAECYKTAKIRYDSFATR